MKISKEAAAHPNTETGASLIGVEIQDMIVVLDIIPDEVNIFRAPGLFKNGSSYQVELFQWYQKHWKVMREKSRQLETQIPWGPTVSLPDGYVPKELDFDLNYLGDWHKHPGSMTYLSGQDISTIREILSDASQNRGQLLSPLITHLSYSAQKPLREYEMRIDNFRMTWYYTSRNLDKPVGIKPFPIKNQNLPKLPPIPWQLSDIRRFEDEIYYLNSNGYNVQWKHIDIDKDGICEVVFSIDSAFYKTRYLVVTRWNYPYEPPQVFSYASGNDIYVNDWSTNAYIVDYLLMMEGFFLEQPVEQSRGSRWNWLPKFDSIKGWSRWPRFSR